MKFSASYYKYIPLYIAALILSGCATVIGTETSFTPWRGEQQFKGTGGAVEEIDGVEFWKAGDPERSYEVIGLITQRKSDDTLNKIMFDEFNRQQVVELVKKNNGDGVVTLKSERFVSGYTTTMPINQYGSATTSPDYAKASVLAVFRYVSSDSSVVNPEERPTSVNLANMENNPSEIIRFDCYGSGSTNQIDCLSAQLSIWGHAEAGKQEGMSPNMKKPPAQDRQQFLEQAQELLCAEDKIEKAILAKEANPDMAEMINNLVAFCKTPTYELLSKIDLQAQQHNSQTCLVSVIASPIKQFTYDEKTRRWLSKTGPSGPCGGMVTEELYKGGKASDSEWIYTTHGVATKKGAHKMCATLYDEKPHQYRSRIGDTPKLHKLNCTYINY